MLPLIRLPQIDKNDHRGIPHRNVLPRENQPACPAIHAEDRDVVAALVAAVEKPARGIEVEAARIITPRPFHPPEGELSAWTDREDPDAVVQAVARLDEAAVGRNQLEILPYGQKPMGRGDSGSARGQGGSGQPFCYLFLPQ